MYSATLFIGLSALVTTRAGHTRLYLGTELQAAVQSYLTIKKPDILSRSFLTDFQNLGRFLTQSRPKKSDIECVVLAQSSIVPLQAADAREIAILTSIVTILGRAQRAIFQGFWPFWR